MRLGFGQTDPETLTKIKTNSVENLRFDFLIWKGETSRQTRCRSDSHKVGCRFRCWLGKKETELGKKERSHWLGKKETDVVFNFFLIINVSISTLN